MTIIFTDAEIEAMIAEPKALPPDWREKLAPREKPGHVERALDATGANGNRFVIIIRKSKLNPNDFSVILAVRIGSGNRIFRLRRYNGRSHDHTNSQEGDGFFDFHIHYATERYQAVGNRNPREDAYAVATDRYDDATGAMECLMRDAGFEVDSSQGELITSALEV